ncbi:MAG: M24 family metallopeptidase [Gemmatimonadetes bacterium]|nr:M24 family metallopeptidase [Gemmatimonadota bacterium]
MRRLLGPLLVIVGSSILIGAASRRHSVPPPGYRFAFEDSLSRQIDFSRPDSTLVREIFARRRDRVLRSIPEGVMLIHSVEWTQPRRLEFQVPASDNHDFIYLTGLAGLASVESALLLVPAIGDEPDWVVLYSSAEDLDEIRRSSGIDEVRPFSRLEQDLSLAMTDLRDWRITQQRRWPLPRAIARRWGNRVKPLYLNYPRFFRLGRPEPERLEAFEKIRRFSPEIALRDAADILDPIRMYHDALALASLRRAVWITGEGIKEGFRAAKAGRNESEIMEIIDFVYRFHGADLGFPTEVQRYPPTGPAKRAEIPEGFIQYQSRSTGARLQPGDMVHTDTGAEFNFFSADIQRNVAVDGTLTPEQRRIYEIALRVQKTVIDSIRPGVTWWQLHRLAERMLRDAGGYDRYYRYGIGHFIGMEVHDEGDYDRPLEAGMALSIEQGVFPPNGPHAAFEDDIIVTATGREWVSRSIPIEIREIEALAREPSGLAGFLAGRAKAPGER